jgi:hypothetical protein
LPQPYVSKLEHGEYPWGFTERMAAALAAALGVALSDVTESRLLTRAEEQRIQELVSQLNTVMQRRKRPGRAAA